MHDLEFLGGPFDGHKECLEARPADELAWLVCDDAFGTFAEQRHRKSGTITSVVIYELEIHDGLFRYQFLEAISLKDVMDSGGSRSIRIKKGGLGKGHK